MPSSVNSDFELAGLGARSCYIFSPDNAFRQRVVSILRRKWFSRFIISTIIANSIFLTLDDPTLPDGAETSLTRVLNTAEIIFTVIFVFEATCKIISLGFVMHPGSYLRSGWNKLDFFVVVLSLLAFLPSVGNYSAIRSARVLRPLRSITNIPGLRVIVSSLLQSLPPLLNVFFLCAFVFAIFGILFQQLFAGILQYRCLDIFGVPYLNYKGMELFCGSTSDCPADTTCGLWDNPNYGITSFDTIGYSWLLVFQIITISGWVDILYAVQDSYGWWVPIPIFVALVLFGSYFLINLALAVISEKYANILDSQKLTQFINKGKIRRKTANGSEISDATSATSGTLILSTPPSSLPSLSSSNASSPANASTPALSESPANEYFDPLPTKGGRDSPVSNDALLPTPLPMAIITPGAADGEEDNVLASSESQYSHDSLLPHQHHAKDDIEDGQLGLTAHALGKNSPPKPSAVSSRSPGTARRYRPSDEMRDKALEKARYSPTSSSSSSHIEQPDGCLWPLIRRCLGKETAIQSMDEEMPSVVDASSLSDAQKLASAARLKMLKLASKSAPNPVIESITTNIKAAAKWCRRFARKLLRSQLYSNFMMAVIMTNTVVLAMGYYDAPDDYVARLDTVNAVLTSIFTIEAVVKCTGIGLKAYFKNPSNLFDFLIVAVSLAEMFMDGNSGVSALRAFRVMRVFKLFGSCRSLKDLAETIWKALSSLTYLSLLIVLFIFIDALVGMSLFGGTFEALGDDRPYYSFDSFYYSVLTSFQVMTLDSWEDVLHSTMKAAGTPAAFFFVFTIVVGTYLLLALFLAILIRSFAEQAQKKEAAKKAQSPVTSSKNSQNGSLENSPRSMSMPPAQIFAPRIVDSSKTLQDAARLLSGSSFIMNSHNQVVPDNSAPAPSSALVVSDLLEAVKKSNYGNDLVRGESIISVTSVSSSDDDSFARSQSMDPLLMPQKSVISASNLSLDVGSNLNLGVKKSSNSSMKKEAFGSALPRVGSVVQFAPGTADSAPDSQANSRAPSPRAEIAPVPVVAPWTQYSFYDWEEKCGLATVRRHLLRLIFDSRFENFILTVICISSLTLAIDNPTYPETGTFGDVLSVLDQIYTWTFAVEACLKIIGMGLFFNKSGTPYLRDPWCLLDGFVCSIALVSLLSTANVSSLKALRALRGLRPLRLINKFQGLKIVVNSLFLSLPGLSSICLVMLIFYLVFGVLAVQLFGGGMYSCQLPTNSLISLKDIDTKADCLNNNGLWVNDKQNFDNVGQAVLVLFEVATLQDWNVVMYKAIDSRGADLQPKRNANPIQGLFFILFVIVGNFLLLNLFVAVIVDKFNSLKMENDGLLFLTKDQKDWVETQKLMLHVRPVPKPPVPKNRHRARVQHFVLSTRFEIGIALIIFLNVISMAMEYNNQPTAYSDGLEILNYIFTSIFTIEMLLKMFAFGPKDYFHMSGWNKFDSFVVFISWVGIAATSGGLTIAINPTILRVLRIARIARILRLLKSAKGVRTLLETLFYSLPSLANVSALLVLFFFVFSVLGMGLFGGVKEGVVLDDHANFRTFANAMLTLFRLTTGENWNMMMRDCMIEAPDCDPVVAKNCGNPGAPAFFVTILLFESFIMINLFIAIILDAFSTTMRMEESPLKADDLKQFAEIWSTYDTTGSLEIKTWQLKPLLISLGPPLGLDSNVSRSELMRELASLKIPSREGGKIHFVEALIPLARRIFRNVDLPLKERKRMEHQIRKAFPSLGHSKSSEYSSADFFASSFIQALYRGYRVRKAVNLARQQSLRDLAAAADNALRPSSPALPPISPSKNRPTSPFASLPFMSK